MSMSMSDPSGIGIGDEGREGEWSKVASQENDSELLTFFCGVVCCARRPEEKKAEYSSLRVV